MLHALFAVFSGLALAAGTPSGASSSPEATIGSEAYQRALVRQAMEKMKLRPEASPEGKTIERIVVVSTDVVTADDLYPNFFNSFHVDTKADVVERELVFQKGDTWTAAAIEESGRNLRAYLYLTTAQIAAAQGSSPGKVVALVMTKDLWSLRPEAAFSFVGSTLEVVEAHPAEYNFLGRNKILGGDFRYDPKTILYGQRYDDPRVLGSRLALSERLDIIKNYDTGGTEGGVANLSIGQPLLTLDTQWGWSLGGTWTKSVARLFTGKAVQTLTFGPSNERLPYSYGQQTSSFDAEVTRSFGKQIKQNLSLGYHRVSKHYDPDLPNTAPSAEALADFSNRVLPHSESYGKLVLAYHYYQATYLELLDIDTYAISEDFSLGPNLTVDLGWANEVLGPNSNFVEPHFAASYRWKLGVDDYFTLGTSARIRHEEGVVSNTDWVNRAFQFSATNVSPIFGAFRLHTSAVLVRRSNDVSHAVSALGGDNSLRGYASSALVGPQLWNANIELRSRAKEFHTIHIGWAAFIDAGDAFQDPESLSTYASVGAGLRIGIPQFNRDVLRIDFALPLKEVPGTDPTYFVAQFGQAF